MRARVHNAASGRTAQLVVASFTMPTAASSAASVWSNAGTHAASIDSSSPAGAAASAARDSAWETRTGSHRRSPEDHPAAMREGSPPDEADARHAEASPGWDPSEEERRDARAAPFSDAIARHASVRKRDATDMVKG